MIRRLRLTTIRVIDRMVLRYLRNRSLACGIRNVHDPDQICIRVPGHLGNHIAFDSIWSDNGKPTYVDRSRGKR